MGVLNVTPDSFSDGGQFIAPDRALAQARRMIAEGADIIDIGAESTRPYGSQPVSRDEEMRRLEPVLAAVAALGTPVSIDSMKSEVIAWAFENGAAIANDVWGLQRDPDMASVIAAHDAPVIIMHNRDKPDATLDIMRDIAAFFERSLEIAANAGIPAGHVVLDPGIGFGKTHDQSFELVRRLAELKQALGFPLLLGISRKRFIGFATTRTIAAERMIGSVAADVYGALHGADIVRVHDVAAHVEAFAVLNAILGKGTERR